MVPVTSASQALSRTSGRLLLHEDNGGHRSRDRGIVSAAAATGSQGRCRRVVSTVTTQPVVNSRSQPVDTILLVEDDPDTARMYRFKLECDGYRVHLAMTGESALTLAFQSHTDLVLLDIGLP